MKVHCPKCLGTFRIEGEPGVTPFDCPFCKASFSFRDKATIVLASSPLTRVKVEKEETPAEAAEDAASPGSVDEEQSPPLEPATPPPAPEVRPEDLTDLKVGDEVNGYLLEEVVGWGGMSIVFRANQLSLNRNVALKVLRKDLGEDPEFSRRFLKEARALADLSHPNIVQVHDQGVHNGNHYLVMEFIDGVSLRDVMNDHKLVPEEALKIVPALCSALEYAHGRGIIHRDIKPENILLDRAGTPKVADFGLVRMLGESDHEVSRITQTRTIMGTIDYMAPEQRRGSRDIDHRADIYSLGVVLYEMLTGDLPIARFPLPSEKVQVDIRLDEVVLKTLQKDRDRRYQRASLVATDLRRIGEEAPQETPGGRDPSTIGGRLVQMGSSFPFFFFTLVYILVCSVSGEDGAILFFTGLAIPFYLGQLVLHGIMPRPVFPRTSYIYRHPLVSFGLLAVALGILTGNGVLEDELGGMLVGLCISSGLGMALWRHRIFRTSGEPAWLAAPASHGGEPHHRRGPRHWRHRHGRPLRPVPPPIPESAPSSMAPSGETPVPAMGAAATGVGMATPQAGAAAEGAMPAPIAAAPSPPPGPARTPRSALGVIGFLFSLLTLLFSGLVSIPVLALGGSWPNLLLNLPIEYGDLREGLMEFWSSSPVTFQSALSVMSLIPFAPLLLPAGLCLLSLPGLLSRKRRGIPLLLVTAALLLVQCGLMTGMVSTFGNTVAVYCDTVEGDFDADSGGRGNDGASALAVVAVAEEENPVVRLGLFHRAVRLAGNEVVPLEGRAPLVRIALRNDLSPQERKAALVLLETIYGDRLFEEIDTTGMPEAWVDRFANNSRSSVSIPGELQDGFLAVLRNCPAGDLRELFWEALTSWRPQRYQPALTWWVQTSALEDLGWLAERLNQLSQQDLKQFLYRVGHSGIASSPRSEPRRLQALLLPLLQHEDPQIRSRADALMPVEVKAAY